MAVDRAHYHGWAGRLGSPWHGSLALVRVGFVQLFRRKLYWLVFALGAAQFLFFVMSIYVIMMKAPVVGQVQQALQRFTGLRLDSSDHEETAYTLFIDQQSLVVMLLLAFSGSLLVGSDFRCQSLPFYLSRRIDRRHYIAGKLLAVGAVVSLLTTLPALLLFIEYGLFTSSLDYWFENWHIPLSVLAYGSILSLVLGILLVTVSAYLQRTAPIAITWASLFLLLPGLALFLATESSEESWKLIDPWFDIHTVGRLCFGVRMTADERQLALWALALLTAVSAVCLAALVRRVRAVEIVV